jgi:hypothetical protein
MYSSIFVDKADFASRQALVRFTLSKADLFERFEVCQLWADCVEKVSFA